jgi:hypothetical protein
MTMQLVIPGRLAKTEALSFSRASTIYCELRDKSNEGMRTWPEGKLYSSCGIYRISYNGKIWKNSDILVYNPYELAE